MHNLPKCRTFEHYETNTGDLDNFNAHACRSPKHKWTELDNAEWDELHLIKHAFSMKDSLPVFIIERHCDYKEGVPIGG